MAAPLGIQPDTPVDLNEEGVLIIFVKSIIRHENGIMPYDTDTILKGIRL